MPSRVAAAPGAIRNEHGVLISCGGTLVWDDGVAATFECGFDRLCQMLQFAGSRSTVHLDDFAIPHCEDRGSLRWTRMQRLWTTASVPATPLRRC